MLDMCKAIEDMVEEGKQEGKFEGRFEEKLEGIRRQRKKGYTVEDIADNAGMEEHFASQIIELIQKNPQISNQEIISRLGYPAVSS